MDDPETLASAWQQALASDIPVLLEVKIDPEVPPLPPHVTLQQATNYSTTLAKGEPNDTVQHEQQNRSLVKVVQRVPVKIVVDHWPDDLAIGPGMSVVPWVKVR
jgi:hypothetical protein